MKGFQSNIFIPQRNINATMQQFSNPVISRGFIALTSAIIISVLLLAITVTLGFTGFFGRFNILDSESKERSNALAEACVDQAIVNVAQDSSYNPSNESVVVDADHCTILSIADSGTQKTIKTQGIFNKSYTNLVVVIDDNTFDVVSWDEVPNF